MRCLYMAFVDFGIRVWGLGLDGLGCRVCGYRLSKALGLENYEHSLGLGIQDPAEGLMKASRNPYTSHWI